MVGEVSFVVSAALYCTVLYCTLLAQLSPIVSSLAHSNTREVVCGDGLWGLGGKSSTGFPKSSLPAAGMCVLAYHGITGTGRDMGSAGRCSRILHSYY